jgi:hypothetical protein
MTNHANHLRSEPTEVSESPGAGTNPEDACPNGGLHDPIKISYGLPSGDMFDAYARGEIILGGCLMSPSSPTSRCRKCGQETTSRSGPPLDGVAGISFAIEPRSAS